MSGPISALGFGAPWLLAGLALPVLALVAVWYASRRRALASAALGGPPGLRTERGGRLRLALGVLVVAALALAVVAAARPQWGEDDEALAQRGIDLIIALDVSRSMEAQDVQPSRAEAAAAGLSEMLSHMTGNRVGLVVFAGNAFARAPLTVDLPVVTSLVTRAQAGAPLVQPGTNLRAALAEAFRLLDVEDAAETQAVLLVSDGEDLASGYEEAVDFAERRDIRVYTVFAATSDPTALPETSGGTDVSVAQPEVLEAVAEQTDASFRSVDRIPGLAVEFRRLQQTQFEEGSESEPIERFAWFAGAAAALLLLVTMLGEGTATRPPRLRRGVIAATLSALAAVLVAGCGSAAWQHVQAGNDAFEDERFEEALAEYQQAAEAQPRDASIQYDIANALHALGRLEESAAAAEQSRTLAEAEDDGATAELALYSLGNTRFRQSELLAARDAYMSALRIDPGDQDAKANLELVLGLLAPTEPPPGEAPGESGAGESAGEGEPEPGEGDEPGESGEPGGEPGEAGETGDPGAGGEPGQGGQDQPPSPGTGPGSPLGTPTADEITSFDEAQAALELALGELGPEVTLEEALRIIELSRRANELDPLPSGPPGQVPPR